MPQPISPTAKPVIVPSLLPMAPAAVPVPLPLPAAVPVAPVAPLLSTHTLTQLSSTTKEVWKNAAQGLFLCKAAGYLWFTIFCAVGMENTSYNLTIVSSVIAGLVLDSKSSCFIYRKTLPEYGKYIAKQIAIFGTFIFLHNTFFSTDYNQLQIPLIFGVQLLAPAVYTSLDFLTVKIVHTYLFLRRFL